MIMPNRCQQIREPEREKARTTGVTVKTWAQAEALTVYMSFSLFLGESVPGPDHDPK